MSYYDSSTLTKRKQNKVISNDFFNRLNSNNLSYGPQLGISSDSIINNVKTGVIKNINKCNGSFSVDNGCPCSPFTIPNTSISYTLRVFNNPNLASSIIGGQFNKIIEVQDNIIGIINTPRFSVQTPTTVGVTLNLLNTITTNSPAITELSVGSNTSNGYAIIVSFKKNGYLNWVTKIDTPDSGANLSVFIQDVTYDVTGIYVTGTVGYTGTIPPGSQQLNFFNGVTTSLTSASIPDTNMTFINKRQQSFIAKYGFDGTLLWKSKMETLTSSNISGSINAANGVVYFSGLVLNNANINIYNSSDILKSVISSSPELQYIPICIFSQSGELLSVAKIGFSGVLGSSSIAKLKTVDNKLYISFTTYNQTVTIYGTNPTNPLANPTIIINSQNFNNLSPLPTTNGMKILLLSLNLDSDLIINGLINVYCLKSQLTNNNINNANMFNITINQNIYIAGWFQGAMTDIFGNNYTAISGINPVIFILDSSLNLIRNIQPFGSEARVYDIFEDSQNIYLCGLSNGTVFFPSTSGPNIAFTAQGANDAIIFSYSIDGNLNWITNWQSPTFENALSIIKSNNIIYAAGYIDQLTNFYLPDFTTKLPSSNSSLTFNATSRSPNIIAFSLPF